MIQTIAQIFGIAFVSIILICLVWTILSYIIESKLNSNNKLEENLKNFDKKINNEE